MDISTFVVNPVTLSLLVMFLVQFVKDLGLKGNWLRVVSLLMGGVLALAFKARELYPVYQAWIDVGFFVLAVGLGASGAYSLIDETVKKFTKADYVPMVPSRVPGIKKE
jgi:hypothetical protein